MSSSKAQDRPKAVYTIHGELSDGGHNHRTEPRAAPRRPGTFYISTERIATWRTKQLLGLPAHFARGGGTIQLVEPREVVLVWPPRLEQPLAHLRLEGEACPGLGLGLGLARLQHVHHLPQLGSRYDLAVHADAHVQPARQPVPRAPLDGRLVSTV
eukprot:scaffold564_cov64-Phaeocystis_antarctica.AAC.4